MDKSLARRLQIVFASRPINQSEVAQAAGMTRQKVSMIVTGANPNPGIQTVERIAEAIGITLGELFADDLATPRR